MDELELLKKKIEHYEKKLGLAKHDPAYDSCVVLNSIVKQQNDYLKSITIKDLIVSEDKSKSSEYERAKGLWESLAKNVTSLNTLKAELGIDFVPDNPGDGETPFSPQSVGKKPN